MAIVDVVLTIVGYRPGITDDQLAFAIFGRRRGELVGLECNHLVELGELERRWRKDGLIGNYRVHPFY
jgi:hypothetical protein